MQLKFEPVLFHESFIFSTNSSIFYCCFWPFYSLLAVFQDAVAFSDMWILLKFRIRLIPHGPSFLQGLTIVTHVLREGGKFIAKIFRGKDTSLLYCQVNQMLVEILNISTSSCDMIQLYTYPPKKSSCDMILLSFSKIISWGLGAKRVYSFFPFNLTLLDMLGFTKCSQNW